MFGAVCRRDLHQSRLQWRAPLPPPDTIPTYSPPSLTAAVPARLSSMSRGTWVDGQALRAVLVNLSHACPPVLVSGIKRAPLVVADSALAEGVAQSPAGRMSRGGTRPGKVNCGVSKSLLPSKSSCLCTFCLFALE